MNQNGGKYSYIAKAGIAALAMFFLACENDPQAVRDLNIVDNEPLEYQENVRMVYTDSAVLRFEMLAPIAANYPEREDNEPYTEFPEGIDVVFFDNFGEPESSVKANYAIRFPRRNQWEAKGDVVVIGKTGEKLNTEHLIWDERREIIYSDEFVTINTGSEIFMGEGFEADQGFTQYTIKKIVGELSIDD
jgi:LPS export ABC transporter protein LptC